MVMPPQMAPLIQADGQCYARNDHPNIIHPGLWICPPDLRHGVFSQEYVGFNTGPYPDDKIQLSIERTHDNLGETLWNSKNKNFQDHHRLNIEAFVSHKVNGLTPFFFGVIIVYC